MNMKDLKQYKKDIAKTIMAISENSDIKPPYQEISYIILVKSKNIVEYIHKSFNECTDYYYNIPSNYYYDILIRKDFSIEQNIIFIEYNNKNIATSIYVGKITSLEDNTDNFKYIIYQQITDSDKIDNIISNYLIDIHMHICNKNMIIRCQQQLFPINYNKLIKCPEDQRNTLTQISANYLELQPHIYNLYCQLIDENKIKFYTKSIQGFHGAIGYGNDRFAKLKISQFCNPKEYITAWLQGYQQDLSERKIEESKTGFSYPPKALDLLFHNESFIAYLLLYLQRNFYIHYKERTRKKVSEFNYVVHFGDNKHLKSLYVSPYKTKQNIATTSGSNWQNKMSEVLKVDFEYFSIGHLLKTGIVVNRNKLEKFNSFDDVLSFYENLYKIAHPANERPFIRLYINYISDIAQKDTQQLLDTPLLIPEFRYKEDTIRHEYRIDFLIINCTQDEYCGIDLSPTNTHVHSETINKDWNKETIRLTKFVDKYHLQPYYFADDELSNISNCFNMIKKYLIPSPLKTASIPDLINAIKNEL